MTNPFKLKSLNFQRCRDGLFSNIVLSHLLIKNMITSSSSCKINANFCILQKNQRKINYFKQLKKLNSHTKRKTINTINTRASALEFLRQHGQHLDKKDNKKLSMLSVCCLCCLKKKKADAR